MAKTRDMTQGSPTKLILGFFFPILFGSIFQQVYNMVDTIVVGRYLGVEALAGVGSTGPLNFLVLGFCTGVCTGFAIPVAQKFGEGDYAGLKRFVVNAILTSCVLAAVITLVVSLLCRNILQWMNTPEEIMKYAYNYMIVIFLGIPVVFMYNILFGIIRSLGDSRTPVYYLVLSSLLNVGLDLLFILVFHTGVEGAALATVISQLAAALMCVRYIRHSHVLIFEKKDWHPEKSYIVKLLNMGLPTGMQYSITAVGSIILQTGVNGLGPAAVASISTGNKLLQLMGCPFEALGSTMGTFAGQNVGARKLKRINKGLLRSSILGITYSLLALLLVTLFADPMLQLFIGDGDASILADARRFVITNVCFYTALVFVQVVRFSIQGMGFSKQAVFAGVFELVARTVTGIVLIPAFGIVAAGYASPLAWIAADLFLFPAYFVLMRRLRKQMAADGLPFDQE